MLSAILWSPGPELPAPRTDAAAVVAPDGSVYLLGGDAALATSVPQLTSNGTSWVTGQNIDTQRNDLGAVRAGSAIYLFGGTGNNEGSDEALSYDYRFGDSQDLAKMSTIRYDFGYAADGSGRAYAIGGIGVFDDGEIWSQAERYDPASGAWSPIASLPQALHGMTSIGDGNGHIFVFGGSTTLGDSGIQDTSFSYDIATDTWSTIGPMPVGTRDSAVVMDDSGSLYVLGGVSSTGATDAVQVYDPATNTWTMQTALSEPVYSHAAAFDASGRIIVAGGFNSTNSATTAVYRTQQLNIAETAPIITTGPVTSASLDTSYTYDVNAHGNPAPTFSLVSAPNGMTIDSVSGLISWQPVAGQQGVQPVTVRASNVVGDVDQTFDITVLGDTIAPTTPTNLTVDSTTQTTATISWDASSDANGVDHYEVFSVRRVSQRFRKRFVYTLVDTVTTTNATLTGLTPLTFTNYTVQAVDAAGNRSGRATTVTATTLSTPDLTFRVGTQTSGTVQSPAKTPLEIQLSSRANPTATFSLVSGPAGVLVDPVIGLVQWTPTVADVGLHTLTFRAANALGSADLAISVDITSDAPQLSVVYNPGTGGQRHALAGTLFTAQINDASNSPSTYLLVSAPTGMSIDAITGLVSWTPTGDQGGTQTVTVRGANAGGTTDLTFSVLTHFTGAVTGVSVTGTTLAEPTAQWVAPTGEGSNLVASYKIDGLAKWRSGRARRSHRVSYTVAASDTSVLMTGLVTGRNYTLTVTALDAAGNPSLANTGTTFVSVPALPQVRWSVNGFSAGVSTPAPVVAGQPLQIVLTDQAPDPSTIALIDGPAGLTFDPATNTAVWTPTAADVTTGFATTMVTFEATNSVGPATVVVPLRVFFSGAVKNLTTTRFGNVATAEWDAPTDNANPVVGYKVTRHWTWSGRKRSATWTVGNVTSITFSLIPTGSPISHKGVSVSPIDADGNVGVSSGLVRFGSATNNLPPVAVDDTYIATEDVALTVNVANGVRANDIDTDNTPFINPLTVHLVSGPVNGTLTLARTGSFTYTPNADFNGSDSFTYRVNDGKFNSNVATATINVGAVNDTPSTLDDNYTLDQDTTLTVNAASGVFANDADIDGDTLTASIVDLPANGTVVLNADGSFAYTPNAGFSGNDTFTYVANDLLDDSRTATVTIVVNTVTPPGAGTKFFVVDFTARGTFEYDASGSLVENYALPKANKKPLGVAANTDGSLIWTVDKSGKVFVYDDAGNQLGSWVPEGLDKPDGIATDGTDVWIVDRKADRVFRYAGAATLRDGSVSAADSFALVRGNRAPKGITTDGSHLWVVNDFARVDQVFKYDLTGTLVGRWTIDSANTKPTGITIDPSDVNHIWIADSAADSVFAYSTAATRISDAQNADAVFALDAANVNPQGIADPAQVVGTYSTVATADAPLADIDRGISLAFVETTFMAHMFSRLSTIDLGTTHMLAPANQEQRLVDSTVPAEETTEQGWTFANRADSQPSQSLFDSFSPDIQKVTNGAAPLLDGSRWLDVLGR